MVSGSYCVHQHAPGCVVHDGRNRCELRIAHSPLRPGGGTCDTNVPVDGNSEFESW